MRTSPTDLLQTAHKGISSQPLKGMGKTWVADKRAEGGGTKWIEVALLKQTRLAAKPAGKELEKKGWKCYTKM